MTHEEPYGLGNAPATACHRTARNVALASEKRGRFLDTYYVNDTVTAWDPTYL